MVIYDVHYNAYALCVQSLNHTLIFVYPDSAVRRVCGVTALGNVVVLGVITPVELRVLACFAFVNRRIVE